MNPNKKDAPSVASVRLLAHTFRRDDCRRIAKQAEVHYAAAQSTPKSDALQRNIGRTIPVRLHSAPSC